MVGRSEIDSSISFEVFELAIPVLMKANVIYIYIKRKGVKLK